MIARTTALNGGGDQAEDVQTLDIGGGSDKFVNNVQIQGYKMGSLKALRPILGLALPTMNLPAAALWLQLGSTWIIGAYESMNVVLRWMLWGIGADLLTGLLCAWFVTKVFSPSFMARGVLVKGFCFAIVVFLAKQPELQFDVDFPGVGKMSTSVGQLLGVYFLTGEWASAMKNFDTLGAPFPKWFSAILRQVHSSVDNIDASQAVSMFTSFTKRTDGNMEVVSKSTTVVTEKAPEPPAADK